MNSNISLYIKRVELHHTKEYIIKVFKEYGIIEDVIFISKSNDNGQKYNGATILFKSWQYNTKVKELFQKLKEKEDSTIKIHHNPKYFWVVSEHKIKKENFSAEKEIPELTIVPENALEIINDLKLKLFMLESLMQKKEMFCMSLENERTNTWIKSKGIEFQLDDKNVQIQWKEHEITELKIENENLKKKLNIYN
jgi:hypothetical protein